MKVAIQQPFFFPYLDYFCLIKHVDTFIVFDTVQFTRHAWFERNRILKPNEGWQWVKLPLKKHSHMDALLDIKINYQVEWQRKITAQLEHYKKKAPYYYQVMGILNEAFDTTCDELSAMNVRCLQKVCDYLEIKTPILRFSEMNIAVEPATVPNEWALNICKALHGATDYYSLPFGRSFFDHETYAANNINLYFPQVKDFDYQQKGTQFEPDLSILDVLMFNHPEKIGAALDNCQI